MPPSNGLDLTPKLFPPLLVDRQGTQIFQNAYRFVVGFGGFSGDQLIHTPPECLFVARYRFKSLKFQRCLPCPRLPLAVRLDPPRFRKELTS
jgi:hypothetical protein